MATFTKPTVIPIWNTGGANRATPPGGKLVDGWLFNEVPPSSYENWKSFYVGSWLEWIDERFADGATNDVIRIINPAGPNRMFDLSRTGDLHRISDGGTQWIEFDEGNLYFDVALSSSVVTRHRTQGLSVEGGLHVGVGGIAATPVADRISVGQQSFRLDYNGGDSTVQFDAGVNTSITWVSGSNFVAFNVSGNQEMQLIGGANAGLKVLRGLVVGSTNTAVEDAIVIGDGSHRLDNATGNPTWYVDSATGDNLSFNRSAGPGGLGQFRFTMDSILIGGFDDGGAYINNSNPNQSTVRWGNTQSPVRDGVTNPNADSFRMGMCNTPGILTLDGVGPGNDFMLFEKTDASGTEPDGWTIFANTAGDGIIDVAVAITGNGTVLPGKNDIQTLGRPGNRWKTGYFGLVAAESSAFSTPTTPEEATIRGARNSISAHCTINAGVGPTVNPGEFNVASVVRTGTGNYEITTDEPISDFANGGSAYVSSNVLGSISNALIDVSNVILVDIETDAGAPIDTNFTVIAVGLPANL